MLGSASVHPHFWSIDIASLSVSHLPFRLFFLSPRSRQKANGVLTVVGPVDFSKLKPNPNSSQQTANVWNQPTISISSKSDNHRLSWPILAILRPSVIEGWNTWNDRTITLLPAKDEINRRFLSAAAIPDQLILSLPILDTYQYSATGIWRFSSNNHEWFPHSW